MRGVVGLRKSVSPPLSDSELPSRSRSRPLKPQVVMRDRMLVTKFCRAVASSRWMVPFAPPMEMSTLRPWLWSRAMSALKSAAYRGDEGPVEGEGWSEGGEEGR